MKKYLAASALVVLLNQCAPECTDPASTDGPQFEQEQAAQQVTPGDCDSYVPLFEAYGLPVATFKRIAWRESGCNHTSWVFNRTDSGGGLLGINFKGSLAAGWYSWCGATLSNFRYDPELQVRCAREAYNRMGLAPWQ
jgi:hypothetical protein